MCGRTKGRKQNAKYCLEIKAAQITAIKSRMTVEYSLINTLAVTDNQYYCIIVSVNM